MTTRRESVTDATERDAWDRNRIRAVVHWVTTLVIVVELAAGSVWNLVPIDWITAQLHHLGYPALLADILGFWQLAAAVAIIVPAFALVKEWAYVGSFFLWSGAVVSHLIVGDGPTLWGVPMLFGVFAVASWVSRPSDRRLSATMLPRHRRGGAEAAADSPGPRVPGAGRRAWTVSIALMIGAFVFAVATLPVVEPVMHERGVELGWIDE